MVYVLLPMLFARFNKAIQAFSWCSNVISKGDPLEIYTSPDGEVIFKKYSPIGEISSTASQYADVLSKVGGRPAVICDRDHVIAVSGISKKEVIERRVSVSSHWGGD